MLNNSRISHKKTHATTIIFVGVSVFLSFALALLFPKEGAGGEMFIAFCAAFGWVIGQLVELVERKYNVFAISFWKGILILAMVPPILYYFPHGNGTRPWIEFVKGWHALSIYESIYYNQIYQVDRFEVDRPLSMAAIYKFRKMLPQSAFVIRLYKKGNDDREMALAGCVIELRGQNINTTCPSLNIRRDSLQRLIVTGGIDQISIDTISIDANPYYGWSSGMADNGAYTKTEPAELKPSEGFDFLLIALLRILKD